MSMSGVGVVLGFGGATEAFAFEALTVTNGAAVGPTAATTKTTGKNLARAVFTVEAGSVRYRYDGTAPTTSVGHLVTITAGNTVSIVVEGPQSVRNMLFIATTATNATVSVTYEAG